MGLLKLYSVNNSIAVFRKNMFGMRDLVMRMLMVIKTCISLSNHYGASVKSGYYLHVKVNLISVTAPGGPGQLSQPGF